MRSRRLWLCVAPTALCLVDGVSTLVASPSQMWAYRAIASGLLWISLFSLSIVFLPRRLAKVLALAVTLGHALKMGALEDFGHPLGLGTFGFLATGLLVVVTWEKADAEARETRDARLGGDERFVARFVRLRYLVLGSLIASLGTVASFEVGCRRQLRKARPEHAALTQELALYGMLAPKVEEEMRKRARIEKGLQARDRLRGLPSLSPILSVLYLLDGEIFVREVRLVHGDLSLHGFLKGDRTEDKLRALLDANPRSVEWDLAPARDGEVPPGELRFPNGGLAIDLRAPLGKGFLERLAEERGAKP